MSETEKKQTFKIVENEDRLGIQLIDSESSVPMKPLFLDFTQEFEKYSRDRSLRNQIFMKALGVKKGTVKVLDGTAGFCSDSLKMLAAGLNVTALEAHPAIFKLIDFERTRFLQKFPHLEKCFTLLPVNTLDFLHNSAEKNFDAIYLDPMFPEKKKALSPKEMQILQVVVGSDQGEANQELCRVALEQKIKRLVVKRPLNGSALIENPSHKFLGKSIRYDMYLV